MTRPDAVPNDAVRTWIGRDGGTLLSVRPDDRAALKASTREHRMSLPEDAVEGVTLGCAGRAGEDYRSPALMALAFGGRGEGVPATTIYRPCLAIHSACQAPGSR